MHTVTRLFPSHVAFTAAALALGACSICQAQTTTPEVNGTTSAGKATPAAAPEKQGGRSIEIPSKKRKSIATSKFPYTLEYWTGDPKLGWKSVTLKEPGNYGFQFTKGRYVVTAGTPSDPPAEGEPPAKPKISLANRGAHPVTIHLPDKKSSSSGTKSNTIGGALVKKKTGRTTPSGGAGSTGDGSVVTLFPSGPGMSLASRQATAAANAAASANQQAQEVVTNLDSQLKDGTIAALQTQNAMKAAQLTSAGLPPGPAHDAAKAQAEKLQADLATQVAALRVQRAALDSAKLAATAAKQAQIAAAFKAAGLVPKGGGIGAAGGTPALAKLIASSDSARKRHDVAKGRAERADLLAKDAKIDELKAQGELAQAKHEASTADKQLAAAVKDLMLKNGKPGEAAAKALVDKLKLAQDASKKKLDAVTKKAADAGKKVADTRDAAGQAKLAADKARNALQAECAKLMVFALRNLRVG